MLCLIPINGGVFMVLNNIRKIKVKVTDTRVKLMNEILSGVRVLKYYAWEKPFAHKVEIVREEELQLLKRLAYVVAMGFTLILMSAPIVQPILIFFTYIKLGNVLDAATAFTTISLFNVMQFPFAFLPMGLGQYSQVSPLTPCSLSLSLLPVPVTR
jgi:ABC transporter transmembrane region